MKRAFGAPGPKLEPHFSTCSRSAPKPIDQSLATCQNCHSERSEAESRNLLRDYPSRPGGRNVRRSPQALRNSIQSLRHRNLRLAQHMLHLRLPQSRCVILKRQFRLGIVQPELPQSINIGKFAEFL